MMKSHKPKILLIVHELSRTGAPKIIVDTFQELVAEVDLRTITPFGGPLEQTVRRLGPLMKLPIMPVGSSIANRASRTAKLAAVKSIGVSVALWHPDLIYVNSIASLPVVERLQLPNVPVILHVHELNDVLEEFVVGRNALFKNWPNAYIADSSAVFNALVNDFEIPSNKVELVYEFVDDDIVAPLNPRPSREQFVVGGAGYPSWRKAPLLWLQMAAELVTIVGPDKVRFTWVGVPNDEQDANLRHMRAVVKKLGLEKIVNLIPVTSKPLDHFATFDIFAVTSWEEPFSIVMAENMMLGNPGVCFSGCGGTPEVIGETGLLVSDFSPRAMAEAIADLVRSPERLKKMGCLARERVQANFTASLQIPKVHELIKNLIAVKRSDTQSHVN